MSDLKNYPIYSEKFSQQKPRKCKIQNPKGAKNHTKLTIFWRLGDIPPRPVLTAIARYQEPSSHKKSVPRTNVGPKRPHSTLQLRLSASSLNSFMDFSCEELPQVFHVAVVSLWWHRQAIGCFSERLLPSWHINRFKKKNMHHVNLFPFCTGHLPS